jgi:peptide/nickel transport system permease protein
MSRFGTPSAKVNWHYVLGTDNLGRDNLARFLSGGRVSISVGLTAMILSIVLGTFCRADRRFFQTL